MCAASKWIFAPKAMPTHRRLVDVKWFLVFCFSTYRSVGSVAGVIAITRCRFYSLIYIVFSLVSIPTLSHQCDWSKQEYNLKTNGYTLFYTGRDMVRWKLKMTLLSQGLQGKTITTRANIWRQRNVILQFHVMHDMSQFFFSSQSQRKYLFELKRDDESKFACAQQNKTKVYT